VGEEMVRKSASEMTKETTSEVPWSEQKILFVSGKGGVGKSLVAAAIAREQAKAGRRVLLAEIGETSYFRDYWNLKTVGHTPTPHPDGFDIALWSGDSCLHEYVLYYLRMERLYKLFFENRVMRALVNVAPGLNELAILGKITSGLRKVGPELRYDLIVVDGYATGHAMALFEAPKGMMEAVKFGPMGHHGREMANLLSDPKTCGYVLVTLLEELPIVETLEFKQALKAEFNAEPVIVANRVLPLPAPVKELERLQAHSQGGTKDFTSYLLGVTGRQREFLAELRKSVATVLEVPQVFSADPDELVRNAGEALCAK
jgi:anion-transporting  ArsA/GET3 family ATPase